MGREQSGVTVRFDGEGQDCLISLMFGRQLDTVVEVVIAHSRGVRNRNLPAGDIVFIAIDDGPYGLLPLRPLAGKDSVALSGIKRAPLPAREKWSDGTFDGCHPPGRFGVARSDPIPDTPDILPTLPAFAIEEGKLQVVGFVTVPAIGDVHLVPRARASGNDRPGARSRTCIDPR